MSVIVHLTGRHVADDFDRVLSRVFLHFQPPSDDRAMDEFLIEAATAWRDTTDYPGLVRGLYWIHEVGPGPQIQCLEPGSAEFAECAWPSRLTGLRSWLAETRRAHGESGLEADVVVDSTFGVPYPLLPRLPGLAIPHTRSIGIHQGTAGDGEADRFEAHVAEFLSSMAVVRLDPEVLYSHLLPELLERYRLGHSSDYVVRLRERASGELVFSSPSDADPPDVITATLPIFALRSLAEMRSMLAEDRGRELSREEAAGLNLAAVVTAVSGDQGGWILEIAHREGSLAAVVAKNQRRHMWLVGGVLAVLLLALASIQLSNRRAQVLARQRLEFVAGVSHELKTPLAAIRSLTQNLSRGVVAEPEKVREYGAMIESEEKRLSSMVDQVLAFSGALSEPSGVDFRRVDLRDLVEDALDPWRAPCRTAGKELDVELTDEPIEILAEPDSLARAIQNLVANSLKYGDSGRWIRVRLSRDDSLAKVSVEDDGPGIPASEVPHLFEPFFRGAVARSSQRPGSGLGLSLVRRAVEAHGGRARVVSRRGEGATFTLELPLAQGGSV